MSRASTIDRLPDALREAVDRAIRERRSTVDELVAMVNSAGHQVSRSAMGRHRKVSAERLAKYRETQEIAREWLAQMRENPDGDVGQLLGEMLKMLAFRTQMEMQEDGATPDPQALQRLAKALRDLGSTDQIKAKLRRDAEAAARVAAANSAESVARDAGLSEAAIAKIRREVLGIGQPGKEAA